MEDQQTVFTKMVVGAWHSKTSQFDKLLTELSDEQLMNEVSPGRNRGVYLLGHLTAMVGFMIPQLGFGENATPQLVPFFVQTPDRSVSGIPSVAELRAEWTRAKALLDDHIAATKPAEWFQKHASISEEDFAKEPHRNRLNLLLSRASHFDYHLGQLIFLKAG
jgi:hypothetical protein